MFGVIVVGILFLVAFISFILICKNQIKLERHIDTSFCIFASGFISVICFILLVVIIPAEITNNKMQTAIDKFIHEIHMKK